MINSVICKYVVINVKIEDMRKELLKKVEKKPLPKGFQREMVIIGDFVYSKVLRKSNMMGIENSEMGWEPIRHDKRGPEIGYFPEGTLLVKGMIPRFHVKDKKIQAIELLKEIKS